MFDQTLPHQDVAIRILKATDTLMAKYGVQYLSTHKIAKEAGVSVGTIYLYFKDKDELLNQLVIYLFSHFEQAFHHLPNTELPWFEQYRQLWHATWLYLQENPQVVQNMHQYEALPTFRSTVLACQNSDQMAWSKFFREGQKAGVLVDLPIYVLGAMSLHTIWELMYSQSLRNETLSDVMLGEIIARTWKAITV